MQPWWAELDINQHVSNVKYIGRIPEGKAKFPFMCILIDHTYFTCTRLFYSVISVNAPSGGTYSCVAMWPYSA